MQHALAGGPARSDERVTSWLNERSGSARSAEQMFPCAVRHSERHVRHVQGSVVAGDGSTGTVPARSACVPGCGPFGAQSGGLIRRRASSARSFPCRRGRAPRMGRRPLVVPSPAESTEFRETEP
jgi:hypothetical protein